MAATGNDGVNVGKSNKICPNCGKGMKQQFIGLQHCSCETSWQKGRGYFERTPDMVFALQRKNAGKTIRPCLKNKGCTKG